MNEEIKMIIKNQTWYLTEKPQGYLDKAQQGYRSNEED